VNPSTPGDFSTWGADAVPATGATRVLCRSGNGARPDAPAEASQRLDWRFLLPDPILRHVALLGDDDQQLVQALRRNSSSLSLLDLGWRFAAGREPRFDLVVLRSSRLADAEGAAVLVADGGCLYWEIERSRPANPWMGWSERWFFRGGERRVPRSPARLRRHLQAYGFTEVRAHWHRPGFQGAVEIVPLENRMILDYVFDGPMAGRGPVKGALRRLLRRAGLLPGSVPCWSVIACKRACEERA